MIAKIRDDIMMTISHIDRKRFVISLIPYVIIFYAADKIHWLYRYCQADDLLGRLVVLVSNIGLAFSSIVPSLNPEDIFAGLAATAIMWAAVMYRRSNSKNFRHGIEYGSARWGNHKDIAPFVDPVYENNIILTKTEESQIRQKQKYCSHRRIRIR